jgi:hypothetical protein
MEEARWNPLKSEWLRITRGASFDDLVDHGTFLGTQDHPTRARQGLLLFEYRNYIWAVPYVRDHKGIFLKTLYPSRKYTRLLKRRVSP